MTDDIDAGDMRIHIRCDRDTLHLWPVLRIVVDLLGWNHAGLDDVLLVINVTDEEIQ